MFSLIPPPFELTASCLRGTAALLVLCPIVASTLILQSALSIIYIH